MILLPNFLIIGAEKSATTWLYSVLRQHPDVFMPATKEPHFFNALTSNMETRDFYDRLGIDWYSRLFDKWSGEQAVGEATPMYLCDPMAPQRIRDTLPEVRLIACLRNPVDRAYSHFQMAVSKGHTSRSFREVVEADEARFIGRGEYGQQLERYLGLFSRDQLLVLFFEELFANTEEHLGTITKFLAIAPLASPSEAGRHREYAAGTYRSRYLLAASRKAGVWMRTHPGFDRALDLLKSAGFTSAVKRANRRPSQYPRLDPELRVRLEERYRDDVGHLESLLGRPVPWLGQ